LTYYRDDKAVADALVNLLADPDFGVRRQAGQGLQKLNVMPSDRAARASFYVATEQWEGARNLGKDAVEPLIAALGSKDKEPKSLLWQHSARFRDSVTDTLGTIGDPRAVEALLSQLKYSDPRVRATTVKALGRIGDARAVPSLIEALGDVAFNVRQEVAKALGRLKDPRAIDALVRTMNDPDGVVRGDAACALGEIGDARAAATLVAALDDVDQNVSNSASTALVAVGEPAIAALSEKFGSLRADGRTLAAYTLARMGAGAVKPLIRALDDPDEEVRRGAAGSLGWMGDPRAVAPLMALVEREMAQEGDEPSGVCTVAADALGQLGDSRALPVLKAAAERYGIEIPEQENGPRRQRRLRPPRPTSGIGGAIWELEEKAAAEAASAAPVGSE
jgi:HEAT repeat protein